MTVVVNALIGCVLAMIGGVVLGNLKQGEVWIISMIGCSGVG